MENLTLCDVAEIAAGLASYPSIFSLSYPSDSPTSKRPKGELAEPDFKRPFSKWLPLPADIDTLLRSFIRLVVPGPGNESLYWLGSSGATRWYFCSSSALRRRARSIFFKTSSFFLLSLWSSSSKKDKWLWWWDAELPSPPLSLRWPPPPPLPLTKAELLLDL